MHMNFQVSGISHNKVRILSPMALKIVEPLFHPSNWHFGHLQRYMSLSNGSGLLLVIEPRSFNNRDLKLL